MAKTTLDLLADEIRSVNRENGFQMVGLDAFEVAPEWILAKLCLVHTELSEAAEEVRSGDAAAFMEELADVVIRVLDIAGGFGVDFGEIVLDKIEANRDRGFRHGGKRL